MRRAPTAWAMVLLALRRLDLDGVFRALAVLVGLRRLTPRPGEELPSIVSWVEDPGDTGGPYRPSHRRQDPGADPAEPNGSESSSRGNDHGWSNCTMASGADALAYHTGGASKPWGGDLRHRQGDLDGGTDLYDLRDAWAASGHTLTIRSGQGWSKVVADHDAGRAIVIQGTGNVPGSGTFDGGHACCISIETHSDGRWLWGDPLVSDWQWIEPSAIRSWAERWQSSIAFAVSKDVTSTPPPDPVPTPPPAAPCPPQDYTPAKVAAQVDYQVDRALVGAEDALVADWVDWLRGGPPNPVDAWGLGAWSSNVSRARLLLFRDPCNPVPDTPAAWAREAEPYPIRQAAAAASTPADWGTTGSWRESAWR